MKEVGGGGRRRSCVGAADGALGGETEEGRVRFLNFFRVAFNPSRTVQGHIMNSWYGSGRL